MATEHRTMPAFLPACCALLGILCLGTAGPAAADDVGIEIQHWETENGARVYFVPAMELPMVDIRMVFDAGSARDGEHSGIARLTSRLLDSGAGDLDADGIAERFEDLGARFSTESHRDMAIVHLRSLSETDALRPALDTLALVVADPTFPEDALDRERSRQLTALQREEQSPGSLASNTYFETVYAGHPYASNPLGDPDTLPEITRDEVRDYHRQYYVAGNAVIALVGALDRADAEELAERISRALPSGNPAPALPEVPQLDEAKRIHVEFPSSQTHVLAGQPGLRRDDPDYFPLYVGNHVLGGSGLVSRISGEVRDQRGLAYSAYSNFSPMRVAGPFRLGLQTRNDQAGEAIEVLYRTLGTFIEQGPDEEELTASIRNLTGGFPLRIASNRDIAGNLAVIGFYGLPLDWLDRFNEQVEAVTAEQIREAFGRRIDPDRMVTVTVGRGEE